MEHNRNLSSVIKSIQDEGPSSSVKEGTTGESVPVTPVKRTGHSVSRILFIFLLAGLAATGIFLFVIGGYGGYFPATLPESSTNSVADTQTVDIQLQTIQETQVQLGHRIDHLAAAVIDIRSIINQWHGQQTLQNDVQHDRKESILEVSPAAADQQNPLSSWDNEVIEVLITELDAAPDPEDKVSVTAVTEHELIPALPAEARETQVQKVETNKAATLPDSTRASGAQVGETAVNRLESVADPQADVNTKPAEPVTKQDFMEQEWVINVAYFQKQKLIQKLMAKLGQAGIATEQQQVTNGGKTGYRLRITGFSTSLEASEYAKKNLDDDLGLRDPWVSRR